jgi:putative endopeptidase
MPARQCPVTQGGTLLPDRDYYLKDDPPWAAIRQSYQRYRAYPFELTGRATPRRMPRRCWR